MSRLHAIVPQVPCLVASVDPFYSPSACCAHPQSPAVCRNDPLAPASWRFLPSFAPLLAVSSPASSFLLPFLSCVASAADIASSSALSLVSALCRAVRTLFALPLWRLDAAPFASSLLSFALPSGSGPIQRIRQSFDMICVTWQRQVRRVIRSLSTITGSILC